MKALTMDAKAVKASAGLWRDGYDEVNANNHTHEWYSRISSETLHGIYLYVVQGTLGDSFLYAVLTNNLRDAFACADAENTVSLHDIVRYCYNRIPGNCWGDAYDVKRWVEAHMEIRMHHERNPLEDKPQPTEDHDGRPDGT